MNDSERRRALGQWFTPPSVADLALALAIDGRGAVNVVDPCCGDGAFLVRARAAGARSLAGLDVDHRAVDAARARLPEARLANASLFEVDPESWMADAVVGNPPYVRQERLGRVAKEAGKACLARDWRGSAGELVGIGRRADLAALCMARMVRLTRPGGRTSVVVSSALLDAGYAGPLWRGLSRAAAVVAIVESPVERWFPDAAVNAVIVVLERGAAQRRFPVARLQLPVDDASKKVRGVADLDGVAELRWADPDRPDDWRVLVRAPRAWFELRATAGDALVPLREVAAVHRGITSGANDVFYVERARARELGVEDTALEPLVRSPRETGGESIAIDPATTPFAAVALPAAADAPRRYPGAYRYLMERSEAADRPTLRARSPWWSLPLKRSRLFLTKAYASRFVQRLAPVPIVADQRVYTVSPLPGIDTEVLAAILNSTFTALALEALGRASLGEGALEWTVEDARDLPVVDPRKLGAAALGELGRAFAALRLRPIDSVASERPHADRAALDRSVAAALEPGALHVLDDVWDGLVRSVARRSQKARSANDQSGRLDGDTRGHG